MYIIKIWNLFLMNLSSWIIAQDLLDWWWWSLPLVQDTFIKGVYPSLLTLYLFTPYLVISLLTTPNEGERILRVTFLLLNFTSSGDGYDDANAYLRTLGNYIGFQTPFMSKRVGAMYRLALSNPLTQSEKMTNLLYPYKSHRVVPDDSVHKGTSKHHKTDEKLPILRCTLLDQHLDFLN